MIENNKNEQTTTQSSFVEMEQTQAISLHDMIDIVTKKWYWFAVSIALFLACGVIYIMKTAPTYQRNATIMVKDSRKGSGSSEMAAFSELAGFSTRRNVDNELFVLQARRLMLEVVDRLNLTVNYTTRSGLRTVDLYRRSPIDVTFVNSTEEGSVSFRALLGENEVQLSHFYRSKAKSAEAKANKKFVVKVPYGEVVTTPAGEIIVNKSLYMDEEYLGRTVNVSKSPREVVATRYRSATNSAVANKMSAIITISLKDVVAKRAEDVINTLIDVYNDDAISDKQQITEATAEFINARLAIISKELGTADGDVKAFKDKNKMVDIKTDIERDLQESSKYKAEGLSVASQIEMARFIKEYLNDPAKEKSLIPTASLGDTHSSGSLSNQISSYNQLILRSKKLIGNGGENNPTVQQIDREIVAMKNAILASLDSHISTLQIKLDNLRSAESKTNLRISSIPKQEQEYLSIARQQRIKEELYLYLLNKREENAISLAITESNARIVDPAFGPLKPVAPRNLFVLLIMLVLGVAVPFTILYLREMLDTSVHSKRDIEAGTSVPYLGDVPKFSGRMHRIVAVTENGHDEISEAFRILRTNMNFMNTSKEKQQVIIITSSNEHAGKTFVSMNLAMTLAFSGARVLTIDLDLRRRTTTKHMGHRSNPNGISKYLSNPEVKISDIISKSEMHENFDFIYAGLQPPNPAEMLMSPRLDELIEKCRKMYDYIIIDTVPAMVIADAIIASRLADLSIYVVREGLLDRRQLPDIEALYRGNKLSNMCIVLNATNERSRRYGYGYTYISLDLDERPLSAWEKFLVKIGLKNALRR